ncbi:MAG: SprT-like domain-containing protein [Ginsengibacter sp.]
MSKKESPLSGLSAFIPEECMPEVTSYLQQYKVHLTITRERKSILGNYRSRISDKNHRITVNGNLNKYSFLITLLHELAHLLAHEKYGHKILPHGAQWKNEYAKILSAFIAKKIFPAEIENILLVNLKNPVASSCADVHLTRALRKYDDNKGSIQFVEELKAGTYFKIKGGRIFIRGEKIKKRFKCTEAATGKEYLFSPVYEVKLISGKLE